MTGKQADQSGEWAPLWSLSPDDPELARAQAAIGRAFGFATDARLEPHEPKNREGKPDDQAHP